MKRNVDNFLCNGDHLYIFVGEVSIQVLYPFLGCLLVFLAVNFLCTLGVSFFVSISSILFQFLCCLFLAVLVLLQ